MMPTTCDRDPLEQLVDQFVARSRKGDTPSISGYVAEYPEYAEQIEQLFPAVAMMEQLRVEAEVERESNSRNAANWESPKRIGDFDIIREIGRGGMGVVYEAEQRSLARRVAVKVLPMPGSVSKQRLVRFQNEAQTTGKLRHTAIVPVFGAGQQDGLHYYVMPLVRGVGLDEIIASLRSADQNQTGQRWPNSSARSEQQDLYGLVQALVAAKFPVPDDALMPPSRNDRPAANGNRWTAVARVGVQAAAALEYAHARGTLHRDIKPGNLLLDEAGNACLVDFGLAWAIEPSRTDRASTKEVVGTLCYMAPEQWRGIADVRSDVYGLGLTLYELLTLRRATDGTVDGQQQTDRRTPLRPIPPRQVDRAIPRDLEAVVMKCLADDPANRYPSASDLAADLRRFLEDRPICARRVSRLEKGWRWCQRNSAFAGVSAVALLLLVALAVSAVAGHVRTQDAYANTQVALTRSEETLAVALEVLEDIYGQLAPDRVWSPADADPAGSACACAGLRSGRSAVSDQRDDARVQPSKQTAAVLENLLVFYDRLAEQFSNDQRVMLEAAIATRRIGDIRQRLGQIDQAEREYHRAVAKLDTLKQAADSSVLATVEWARCLNEIGNVHVARFEPGAAFASHRAALDRLNAADLGEREAEVYRYERARTCFLLANRQPNHSVTSRRRSGEAYRQQAIALLEDLASTRPAVADYRFLLALCYRPLKIGPATTVTPTDILDRQRALEILESLKSQYPQVVDYRYELAGTYAWVHVSLFPWQGRSVTTIQTDQTERALLNALDEIGWIVANNPTLHYGVRSKALIFAKLGAIATEHERLDEATDWFQQAFDTQSALVHRFPELSVHDRVLREFYRLRLAVSLLPQGDSTEDDAVARAAGMLEMCVENLAELREQWELAEDRLATHSLQLAQEELARIRLLH